MAEFREKNIKLNVIFFVIAGLIVPALSIQSRSVNLALETSFLFDPQDIKENATFLSKVQNVLDKIKTVLEPPSPVFRAIDGIEEKDKPYLTKFLSQIGASLIKFDNDDVKKFASDLRDVVYKHVNENKEFIEIVEDARLRAFVKNSVTIWADTDPMILKVEIAKLITNDDSDAFNKLFKIFNKVFDAPDEQKFKKLTKKFSNAVKNKDFTKFLSKTIDFVVFNRYKKLNFLLKHVIKDELKNFTECISKEYQDRVIEENNTRRYSLASLGRSERLHLEKESSESNEKNLLQPKAKEETNKNNDIVLDKDMNVNIRTDDKNSMMLNLN